MNDKYLSTVFVFFADKTEEPRKFNKDDVVRTIQGGTKNASELRQGESVLLDNPLRPALIANVIRGGDTGKTKPSGTDKVPAIIAARGDVTFKGREHLLADPDLMVYSVMNSPEFMPRGWKRP